METDKKLNIDSPDLLVDNVEITTDAYKKAVENALLKHKRAGNKVAVWRDDKVALINPDTAFDEPE